MNMLQSFLVKLPVVVVLSTALVVSALAQSTATENDTLVWFSGKDSLSSSAIREKAEMYANHGWPDSALQYVQRIAPVAPYPSRSVVSLLQYRYGLIGKPTTPITADTVVEPAPVANKASSPSRIFPLPGRINVLMFAATWCGYCRKSYPIVKALEHEYAKQGVAFSVLITTQFPPRTPDSVKNRFVETNRKYFVEEHGLEFPLIFQGDEMKRYGATAIPYFVIVDASGVVRYIVNGWGSESGGWLRAILERMVQAKG